ncbi:MAG: pilus (MSHA type) biogenesis protein MshL [Pseudomonadales bacterium]|nr:pilus (MSHA type) biogenesis protein MshL [Pseudomonadales bacterium]
MAEQIDQPLAQAMTESHWQTYERKSMHRLKGVLVLLCAALCWGCVSTTPQDVRRMDSLEEALLTLQAGVTSSIAEIDSVEAETEAVDDLAPEIEESRFDVSVADAKISAFLRGIVKGTSFNMVVHPDVTGTVSLELTAVSVADVMSVVRDVYGFDYVLEGNVYRVYPDTLRTEIFRLNYLNVARSGRSEVQVSAGKVSDANSQGQNRDGYESSGQEQQRNSNDVVGTIVNTSADADLWAEVSATLQALTSLDEGSHVMITPQVGLIVVKAKPGTLRAVTDYLDRVESSISRQVILEAKVVEVALNEGFQSGIDWHTFGRGSDGLRVNSQHRFGGELSSGEDDFYNPLGSVFALSADVGDFAGTLNLLRTQGTVQVLSSPRIATVNNQKAVIKVGSDEFFVTDISSNTITAGSAINTNDSPELTPFFSGIALDVTPQISAEGYIVLHVHPTVSEVTEQRKEIGGEIVPLAASTIRESDSIVRAKSGQVVVIGGLMQNSANDENAGVPGFRKLPLLGHLFNQKNQSSVKSELVILLRPVIVEDRVQSEFLSQSNDRVRALRDGLN